MDRPHWRPSSCAMRRGVRQGGRARRTRGGDATDGATLTWGAGVDYQKQGFTGHDDKVSKPPYLVHYVIEGSALGSHQSGHLGQLRLKEQIYPGGDSGK